MAGIKWSNLRQSKPFFSHKASLKVMLVERLRGLSHFENHFVTKENHLPAIFGHQRVFADADALLTGDLLGALNPH